MVTYVTRDEFEARVGFLENEVNGEKTLTRYILEQVRLNGDDLAALKTRLDRVETRLGGVESGLGGLENKVAALIRDLPAIVADAVRDVLRERDNKP